MQGSPGNPFLSIIRQEAVEKDSSFEISLLKAYKGRKKDSRIINYI